ncbi:MAG: PDZ domain-containing protein, partial [Xanthomonadales bacterium]|nr:PDZ domain-containing protein [Xanthomonadales bacterium]
LDDYSAFVPAAEPAAPKAAAGPAPGGPAGSIGAQVQVREQRLVISKVFTHGAAYRAGVRSGDLILAIDGVPVRGRRLAGSVNALGGRPGTKVELRLRSGKLPARDVTLVRGVPLSTSVSSKLLPAQIAYLRVNHFHAGTGEEFGEQLETLQHEADGKLRGIVMDLRDNPGGVVRGATRLADGFLDAGLVVYTRGRYPSSQFEYHAEPGQWAPGVPTAILINGASASAAEIVAGALQDHGRAQLIGSKSFGKGTVQSSMYLEDGSLLRLTTARYFTPSGRQIEGTGVAPDIAVSSDENAAGQDAELASALALLAGRRPD